MGQKTSRNAASRQNPFKLFEYRCKNCSSKRPIQYFYRNGVFLPQQPRVVCGECQMSMVVEPFKTVDYQCPSCRKWHKVRLPARSVPLNMYNVSIVNCNCGFKGEVPVGRLMDVVCGHCWTSKRELCGIWTEDGDEVKSYCGKCQDHQRAYCRVPQQKQAANVADMEYTCDNCFRDRPLTSQELLRNQGLAYCSLCGWVGYPEVRERSGSSQKKTSTPGGSGSARVLPVMDSTPPGPPPHQSSGKGVLPVMDSTPPPPHQSSGKGSGSAAPLPLTDVKDSSGGASSSGQNPEKTKSNVTSLPPLTGRSEAPSRKLNPLLPVTTGLDV